MTAGRLAMIKISGSRFQFCAKAAINPRFLVGEGFNSHRGYNITDALANKLAYQISSRQATVLVKDRRICISHPLLANGAR